MNRQEILKKVADIFAIMTDAKEIREADDLMDDLGVSSMDILTLVAYIEEEFHIRIKERSIRKLSTVGDVVDLIEHSIA